MLTRIVIAADHPLLREGLRRILNAEPGFEVVAEVGDGQGAINTARSIKFDILLMDISLLGESSVEAVRVIRRENPKVGIIVFMADSSDERISRIMECGIAGCLLKYADAQILIQAIHKVSGGEQILPPAMVGTVPSPPAIPKEMYFNTFNLSEREMEILNYLVKGASNKEIGAALFISEKTVKNHLSSIYRKLAVSDRTQAALKVVKLNLFQLD